MLSSIPAAPLGIAHTFDVRANGNPDYSVAQGIQDRTVAPHTAPGAQAVDIASAVLKPLGDLIGYVAGELPAQGAGALGVSPQHQQDIREAGPAIANSALAFVGGKAAAPEIPKDLPSPSSAPQMPPVGSPVRTAIDAGYKLPPSAIHSAEALREGSGVGSSDHFPGTRREGHAGSGRLSAEMAIDNQKGATDRLGRQVIGAPEGTPLTPGVMEAAKQPHNAVYDESRADARDAGAD
jgi:hypothetical protein